MIQNTMFNTQVIKPLQLDTKTAQVSSSPSESLQNFGDYLKDAINQVSEQEKSASNMTEKLMLGEVNVDQAMITAEQALLSLQFTTQVRNKAIEAYQEIMRTQI
ncbi:flagellar hook-basal body complex protein FliE [Paenibacillus sp. IHBB 10380]|uniref:flagellar hook-basal body complex protein FliE n=1 Tax=Paenibacillus sp. IHBB 10380 TaxID=1566358 RepID=UPI0005CFE6F0|nr:flagellar hook-basal body complex protein FliE [Paenibacillus sp. IHBB 10380]AJS59174.1 flagellar hook-basal body protein FliE [Paenibacillus sp. IHBB 10380]